MTAPAEPEVKVTIMKYQIADQNNGPFGDFFDSIEAAEAELKEVIKEGQALNDEHAAESAEAGVEVPQAEDFFYIVAHGYRVEFDVDMGCLNWREAWNATQKFSALKEGAGEASGSLKECEQYREAFDEWLEEYQGFGKAALSVRIVEDQFEL